MKKMMALMVLGCIALSASHARGAELQGMPAESSECVMRAAGDMVDYGQLSRWQLSDTGRAGELTPGERRVSVTVACRYAQTFRIRISGDARTGDRIRYGRSGWLSLKVKNLRIDGRPMQSKVLTPEGVMADGGGVALPDGATLIPRNAGNDAEGHVATFDLMVEPRIPESDSRTTAPLESSSAVNVILER